MAAENNARPTPQRLAEIRKEATTEGLWGITWETLNITDLLAEVDGLEAELATARQELRSIEREKLIMATTIEQLRAENERLEAQKKYLASVGSELQAERQKVAALTEALPLLAKVSKYFLTRSEAEAFMLGHEIDQFIINLPALSPTSGEEGGSDALREEWKRDVAHQRLTRGEGDYEQA